MRDVTDQRIDEAFASTQEQLRQGRMLLVEAHRLVETVEDQSDVARLSQDAERLVEEAQATLSKAEHATEGIGTDAEAER
jgi:glutamine synthetase adenylyltransferase